MQCSAENKNWIDILNKIGMNPDTIKDSHVSIKLITLEIVFWLILFLANLIWNLD